MTSMTGNMGPTGMQSGGGRTGNKIPSNMRLGQIQNFTPEQMQQFQQMFQHAGPESYTSRLASGDQSMFGEIEAPALRQFNELQGGLASRFSGMGMGSRRSSGFQNTATSAASNFAQELQANRQNLQQQALRDLRGMSQELLGQKPYDQFTYQKQKKPGFDWGGAGGALAGGIGGFFAGGPIGALQGASLGYNALGRGGQGTSNQDIMSFANTFGGGGNTSQGTGSTFNAATRMQTPWMLGGQ